MKVRVFTQHLYRNFKLSAEVLIHRFYFSSTSYLSKDKNPVYHLPTVMWQYARNSQSPLS